MPQGQALKTSFPASQPHIHIQASTGSGHLVLWVSSAGSSCGHSLGASNDDLEGLGSLFIEQTGDQALSVAVYVF